MKGGQKAQIGESDLTQLSDSIFSCKKWMYFCDGSPWIVLIDYSSKMDQQLLLLLIKFSASLRRLEFFINSPRTMSPPLWWVETVCNGAIVDKIH